jgi:hypothetical protein
MRRVPTMRDLVVLVSIAMLFLLLLGLAGKLLLREEAQRMSQIPLLTSGKRKGKLGRKERRANDEGKDQEMEKLGTLLTMRPRHQHGLLVRRGDAHRRQKRSKIDAREGMWLLAD